MTQDVFILSATRTAIGAFGGSLKHHTPIDLGIEAGKSAIARSGLTADQIDHAVFGNVSIPKRAICISHAVFLLVQGWLTGRRR